MTTPIDRESVEDRAKDLEGTLWYEAKMLRALRAALDAAEAKNKRLREALNVYAHPCEEGPNGCMYEGNMCCKTARDALQENPDG